MQRRLLISTLAVAVVAVLLFGLPLAFVLDPASRRRDSREWQGKRREFYVFEYGAHYVWGATAAILVNFSDRMRA